MRALLVGNFVGGFVVYSLDGLDDVSVDRLLGHVPESRSVEVGGLQDLIDKYGYPADRQPDAPKGAGQRPDVEIFSTETPQEGDDDAGGETGGPVGEPENGTGDISDGEPAPV